MKKFLFLFFVALMLTSCMTAGKLSNRGADAKIGMTEAQVKSILGNPKRIQDVKQYVAWQYRGDDWVNELYMVFWFEDGKVVAKSEYRGFMSFRTLEIADFPKE